MLNTRYDPSRLDLMTFQGFGFMVMFVFFQAGIAPAGGSLFG
jgi:hypothetical protein